MLVKLGNYVVDSNNKENILKIVKMYLNQYIDIEYIDTAHGGYDRNPQDPNAREIISHGIYRNSIFECVYATVDTPYGRYTNREKTVYVRGKELYQKIKKIEIKCTKMGLIKPSGQSESGLSDITLDFSKSQKTLNIDKDSVEKAKNCLKEIGANYNYDEKELEYIYHSCIHDFCKGSIYGAFDSEHAKYELITEGKLSECIERYKYMNNEFVSLKNTEIAKAKEEFEDVN